MLSRTYLLLCILAFSLLPACRSRAGGEDAARGLVIVNAPAAGVVRRVLVREGMTVAADTPIVEIAVPSATPAVAPTRTEDPLARAGRSVESAQTEIEAARAEVVRWQVEVQRLTPLVASGAATQGELDGARAEYDRAQQRFQRAQTAAQQAQSGLVAARQQSQNQTPGQPSAPAPVEQVVAARTTTAGTVSVLNARVGERVTAGQPLASIRTDAP
jgi:multidrug resistance efflux pump